MTAKQLLDALRIVLRQFLAPHLLCERRVQLDIRQPAQNGRIKRSKVALRRLAQRLRTVIGDKDTCVDVNGQ